MHCVDSKLQQIVEKASDSMLVKEISSISAKNLYNEDDQANAFELCKGLEFLQVHITSTIIKMVLYLNESTEMQANPKVSTNFKILNTFVILLGYKDVSGKTEKVLLIYIGTKSFWRFLKIAILYNLTQSSFERYVKQAENSSVLDIKIQENFKHLLDYAIAEMCPIPTTFPERETKVYFNTLITDLKSDKEIEDTQISKLERENIELRIKNENLMNNLNEMELEVKEYKQEYVEELKKMISDCRNEIESRIKPD